METENARRFGLMASPLLSLILSTGCVSSSISADVRSVQDLARVKTLARVDDADVSPASSEEVRRLLVKPLGREDAVKIALLNNRELRAKLRELGVARGRLIQAGLIANPVVEVEFLPEQESSLELRVEYEITSLILAPLRHRVEAASLAAERFAAAGETVALSYQVRQAFHSLVAAEARLSAARITLEALAASREAASALLRAGNIPELDAAARIAAHERARIGVAEVELDVVGRREALQRLLGIDEGVKWSIKPGLVSVPRELGLAQDLEDRAVRASLELAAQRSHLVATARRKGLIATEGWLPEVELDVHSLRGRDGSDDESWRFGAGVSVTVPLFDRKQGTLTAEEAKFDAMRERYHGLVADIRSETRQARERLLAAQVRVLQFEDTILPAEATVVEQTLLQYNAMQLGVFQLLEARREELSMRSQHVDAVEDYWLARTTLDALLSGHRIAGIATRQSGASAQPVSNQEGGH